MTTTVSVHTKFSRYESPALVYLYLSMMENVTIQSVNIPVWPLTGVIDSRIPLPIIIDGEFASEYEIMDNMKAVSEYCIPSGGLVNIVCQYE